MPFHTFRFLFFVVVVLFLYLLNSNLSLFLLSSLLFFTAKKEGGDLLGGCDGVEKAE